MEKIAYPTSASSAAVFRTDEELCNARVNGSNDASYQSNNINLLETPYAIFLDGYAMEGVVLPEVFKVESMRAVQSSNCTKVTDIQTICSALQSDFINYSDGETSCEHPCVYGGETYYYNFQHKNNDGTYGKWMTLAEMGLTECPSMGDFCDEHNTLNMECSVMQSCSECTEECIEEDEDGACIEYGPCTECIDDNDYYSWTCIDYPFSQISSPYCMDGTWTTQN
jgi:hypothetical protein